MKTLFLLVISLAFAGETPGNGPYIPLEDKGNGGDITQIEMNVLKSQLAQNSYKLINLLHFNLKAKEVFQNVDHEFLYAIRKKLTFEVLDPQTSQQWELFYDKWGMLRDCINLPQSYIIRCQAKKLRSAIEKPVIFNTLNLHELLGLVGLETEQFPSYQTSMLIKKFTKEVSKMTSSLAALGAGRLELSCSKNGKPCHCTTVGMGEVQIWLNQSHRIGIEASLRHFGTIDIPSFTEKLQSPISEVSILLVSNRDSCTHFNAHSTDTAKTYSTKIPNDGDGQSLATIQLK